MAVYGNNIIKKAIHENMDSSIKDSVKKNEAKLKAFINKYSKVFFEQEKPKAKANDTYDWRNVIVEAPKFDYINYTWSDYPCIMLKYNINAKRDDEYIIFYEGNFVKFLRSQQDQLNKLFIFEVEDYPGINIDLR